MQEGRPALRYEANRDGEGVHIRSSCSESTGTQKLPRDGGRYVLDLEKFLIFFKLCYADIEPQLRLVTSALTLKQTQEGRPALRYEANRDGEGVHIRSSCSESTGTQKLPRDGVREVLDLEKFSLFLDLENFSLFF